MKFSTLLLGVAAALTGAEALVKPMEHEITTITPQNFDGVIRKNRDVGVSAILFYKNDAAAKTAINGWYNDVAKDLKGMVRIGAVNCEDYSVFCKEHNTKGTFPSIVTYPPLPIPASVYEGKLEKGPLSGYLTRFIPNDNIKVIKAANLDEFVLNRPEIPKVLMFTSKEKSPTLFSALANEFYKEMNFGFVPASEEALAKRYGVKKFPQIIVIRGNSKRPERFTDKVTFDAVHSWLNLFRETFVSGGGFSEGDGAAGPTSEPAPKPWLSDPLPELFKLSADNLCFKKDDKSLCVIFLTDGELDPVTKSTLIGLKDRYASGLDDRGVSFKWMWLNTQLEPNYKALFAPESLPSVVIFNPNKRLRFTKGSGGDSGSISALIDRVSGGDARFTNVPGQKLPEFVKREVEKKEAPKKEGRDEL